MHVHVCFVCMFVCAFVHVLVCVCVHVCSVWKYLGITEQSTHILVNPSILAHQVNKSVWSQQQHNTVAKYSPPFTTNARRYYMCMKNNKQVPPQGPSPLEVLFLLLLAGAPASAVHA